MSIVVHSLHVLSQLEYFLFHLCNAHIVRVIQLSLQSLKNLGLENNNREKEDKTLRLYFCNVSPQSHHPSSISHASCNGCSGVCRASELPWLLYFRYSVSGLGIEIQTGMAEDLHIFFVLPISWQQVSSSNHWPALRLFPQCSSKA